MKQILIGFYMLFASTTFAQNAQVVNTFGSSKSMQIEVQCLNADLKVIHDATTKDLKIGTQVFEGQHPAKDAAWNISVQKDPLKDLVKIQCHYPQKVFVDSKLESSHRYYIIIRGPSADLKVNSRTGKVAVSGWKQPAEIVVERGSVVLDDTGAAFKVNVLSGSIDVSKHTGRLNVDSFKSKVTIDGVEGNVEVTNFTGATQLKGINGNISLNSKSGATQVEGSSGSFKFDADEGKLDIKTFKGSIEGNTNQTSITARLTNPARFKASVKNANINISAPSSSGASVYFALNEGQFKTPAHLTKDEMGAAKTVKGSLRGGESGRISITGDAGRISLTTF